MSRASVSSNTRSCEPGVDRSARKGCPSGRSASTNGWNGSSVPTRSIERPSENLAAGVAGASGEFGYQAGLADAGLSGDEDGRTAAQLHRVEHAPERLELAYAADEDVARANLHLGQYGAETTVRQCWLSITQPEDTAPCRKR